MPSRCWLTRMPGEQSAHPASSAATSSSSGGGGGGKPPSDRYHCVDVGGGRGDLALALAHAMGPDAVHVSVLDVNEKSLVRLAGQLDLW